MRKFLFQFILIFVCGASHGQWSFNSSNNTLTTNPGYTGIGSTNGTGNYDHHFGFSHGSPDWFYLSLKNDINREILSVGYNSNDTFLRLKNRLNQEIFKVSTWSNDISAYVHMPRPDSRFVIGSWGNYLLNEGHKFVVKDGSVKIEGDIFTTKSIGIGTMSFVDGIDTYKLSVNGKVRAHAVKVYTDWADYVFEDSYDLPTLLEVENFIKKNGHLEHIPSAKEVEKKGIDLGEMNKLLLQKVEELTLYAIQLRKEIDQLKKKIN